MDDSYRDSVHAGQPVGPATATRGVLRSEPELRVAVARRLTGQGLLLADRVVCIAGEPDLITVDRTMIVEVKYSLTRKALFQALGQLLLYRQAINPTARALIVGYCTPESLALMPLIRQLGVEVSCWHDQERGHTGRDVGNDILLTPDPSGVPDMEAAPVTPAEEDEPSVDGERETPSVADLDNGSDLTVTSAADDTVAEVAPVSAPRQSDHTRLTWRVADIARRRGIPNASRLAITIGASRPSLYSVWNGTAGQITLDMLARLAHTLEVDPGDWFSWGVASDDASTGLPLRPLLWNVAGQATARGLDQAQLSFRSRVHMSSVVPIWRGTQQAVTPTILGRLALALDTVDMPFSPGALFTWGIAEGD